MRRFQLERDTDLSGVSGTGLVAEGIEFSDGHCALRWRTSTASTGIYDSAEDLIAIHGHGAATRLVWLDELPVAGRKPIHLEFQPADRAAYTQMLTRRGEVIARLRRSHP